MNDAQPMIDPTNADVSNGLLLRGGTVIDGTGGPRYPADLRIHDGRIAEIGLGLVNRGESEIDATGRIVSPGFIDVHTHDDQIVLDTPEMLPKILTKLFTTLARN